MIPLTELVNLKGKTAIVTGGAMGIGNGIACRLAEAGANVVIVDVSTEVGDRAVCELQDKGCAALLVCANVADEEDVRRAVDEAVHKFGSVDILVNNAGIYPIKPVMDMPTADFDKIIAINLKGVFLFTKAVADVMIKAGRGGKIINISSIDAVHPSAIGLAVYDASKHGVWGFTKNCALEFARYNIQVNAIAPGSILTPGTGAGSVPTPEILEIQKKFVAKIPMSRMGEPDDIGRVALFLASGLSSYMTGEQVVVDGGVLLS
jgi:2-deoxy-D-gluconate 3-dehydrogenase